MIFLLIVLLITQVSSQVRINQVVVNVNTNGAVITFKNYGNTPVDLTNYYVGSDNKHIPLRPTLTNVNEIEGSGPLLQPGASWTLDYTPWASSGSTTGRLSQSSDVALWRSNDYSDFTNLVDFVQYCRSNSGSTCPDFGEYAKAEQNGVWFSGTHVRYTLPEKRLIFNGNASSIGITYWNSAPVITTPETSGTTKSPTASTTSGTTRSPTISTSGTTRSPTTSTTKSPTSISLTIPPNGNISQCRRRIGQLVTEIFLRLYQLQFALSTDC